MMNAEIVSIDDLPISSLLATFTDNLHQKDLDLMLSGVQLSESAETSKVITDIRSEVLKVYPSTLSNNTPKQDRYSDLKKAVSLFRELAPKEMLNGLTDYLIATQYVRNSYHDKISVFELYQQGISLLEDSPDGQHSGIHYFVDMLFNGDYRLNYRTDHSFGEFEMSDIPPEMFQEACELIDKVDCDGLTPIQKACVTFEPSMPKFSFAGIQTIIAFGADLADEYDGASLANLIKKYSNITRDVGGVEYIGLIEEAIKSRIASRAIEHHATSIQSDTPRASSRRL